MDALEMGLPELKGRLFLICAKRFIENGFALGLPGKFQCPCIRMPVEKSKASCRNEPFTIVRKPDQNVAAKEPSEIHEEHLSLDCSANRIPMHDAPPSGGIQPVKPRRLVHTRGAGLRNESMTSVIREAVERTVEDGGEGQRAAAGRSGD